MDLRRFRALHQAGVSISAIARETGHDWRTVKKYLAAEGAVVPAAPSRKGTQPRKIAKLAPVVDAWLRVDIKLKAAVIHERLVDQYGFEGHYQRVKMYVAEARPRIRVELGLDEGQLFGLHRRFEVVPGGQAQVDWGDEGGILAHAGIAKVYSFHMVLSYARDPFCCFTTSQDLATFFDCHRRAFEHFGGTPATVVYDRTKTVVKRHVGPGKAVPLHPEAVAFASSYGFDIDVLAAYRPQGKGRVERQVDIVRDHVLAGRSFGSVAEMDAAFMAWAPIRRRQVHRTHSEVIGERAVKDRAALIPLPGHPYRVVERHLRRAGKDCLVSFEGSLYSVPARRIRPGQQVEVRVAQAEIAIHHLDEAAGSDSLLALHQRADVRGSWVVDEAHWDGLADGHTRSVTTADEPDQQDRPDVTRSESGSLDALLARTAVARIPVSRRPLADYDLAAGLTMPGVN
ncbi:transposase [Streptomyces sp. V4I8]|uniref:IS21 family transposase n=1 Tax=Streptomyces sp. V4I8 TaxID=3156469 RepID=UPI003513BCC2